MISALFHTQNAEPWCRLRKKFSSPYDRWAWSFQIAAGNLRRHREKEFINKTRRHKLAEQRGTSLVKEEMHALFLAQKLQYCGWSHEEIGVLENGNFGRVEPIDTGSCEPVAAFQGGNDLDVDAGVRNAARSKSTTPLALTITVLGYAGLPSTVWR